MEKFVNDEKGYLDWVRSNQNGYVVNSDHDHRSPDYPMIHLATHKSMSSPKRTNYTTGRFFKVCSNDRRELEKWAKDERGRPLTPCRTCKP